MNFMNEAQLIEASVISINLENLVSADSLNLLTQPSLGAEQMNEIWSILPADILDVLNRCNVLVHFITNTRRGVFPGNLADGTPFIVIPVEVLDDGIDVNALKVEISQIASGRLSLQGLIATWDGVEYDLHEGIEMVQDAVSTANSCLIVEYSLTHPWLLEMYGPVLERLYGNYINAQETWDDEVANSELKTKTLSIFIEAAKRYDAMKKTDMFFKTEIELQTPKFENL